MPSYLDCNQRTFTWLAEVAYQLDDAVGETVVFDGHLEWCEAQLCAPFGAILHAGMQNRNTYQFSERIAGKVLKVWAMNGFWEKFGGIDMPDEFDTTLTYSRFEISEEKSFAKYIGRELMPKELPHMSEAGKRDFQLSIQEVFSNAAIHSDTAHGVFTCGQRYPTSDRLTFAIADLGIGFANNVRNYFGIDCDSIQAIDWAFLEGHSTKKTNGVPGGLGLSHLLDFITRNGGRLTVVSHEGYWEHKSGVPHRAILKTPFPGTVVVLDIETRG